MAVCVMGYSVIQFSQPYREASNNLLAVLCKLQLTTTLFSALLLKVKAAFFSQVPPSVPLPRLLHVRAGLELPHFHRRCACLFILRRSISRLLACLPAP